MSGALGALSSSGGGHSGSGSASGDDCDENGNPINLGGSASGSAGGKGQGPHGGLAAGWGQGSHGSSTRPLRPIFQRLHFPKTTPRENSLSRTGKAIKRTYTASMEGSLEVSKIGKF
ncbi:uncharacterized protein ACLA_085400 [Aspergillus clavatus NRRL 1]|uniref:Uncharacterized protein n=1 Tax=Aspergillus clavatus (strain ATCC 1007 / CBS 513.65 / DSM 816 / NCTC 3887 / NRRL 1 / QM 1276 / 107) TaxID=344612 RepID=A1CU58_ASPCL|nr:uncharacterized protein ACLA_085400 [Aspergillus clavatus NRRL 1]EAW06845.1 conserved hypothetical protein [Aspergillus clavatus NRRL 1]